MKRVLPSFCFCFFLIFIESVGFRFLPAVGRWIQSRKANQIDRPMRWRWFAFVSMATGGRGDTDAQSSPTPGVPCSDWPTMTSSTYDNQWKGRNGGVIESVSPRRFEGSFSAPKSQLARAWEWRRGKKKRTNIDGPVRFEIEMNHHPTFSVDWYLFFTHWPVSLAFFLSPVNRKKERKNTARIN